MLHKQYTATQMLIALREGVIQPASMQREYCQHALDVHHKALAAARETGDAEQIRSAENEVAVWTARLEATR